MDWVNVNEYYLSYLRAYERRIPFSDYGKNKYKPFFGILFETNDLLYVTQISHPQERHKKIKQQKDFYKIYDPDVSTRLIAVVNLNYMFPTPKNEVFPFDKKKIDTYRIFMDEKEKSKYIDLLEKEIKVINSLDLCSAARNIYEMKYKYPDSFLAQRCLDYKKLELYAKEWI